MKPKTLLVLTVVTLLLGAFIYFVERDVPSTEEKEELESKVLGLDAEDVESFTLHRPGDDPETIRFVREEPGPEDDAAAPDTSDTTDAIDTAGWRIAEPIEAEADAAEIDDVLGRLLDVAKERELEEVNRETAGLDAPRLEIVFETGDGEQRLLVGADVPLGGSVLVDLGGTVMQAQLAEDLLADLGRGVDAWRERDLFPSLRADVERIALSAGESEVVLARRDREADGDDFWIESPLEDRADADRVRVLLAALLGLEAETFLDGTDAGSFEPQATVEVGVAGRDDPFRIELGLPSEPETEPESEAAAIEEGEEPATEGQDQTTLHARVDGQRVTIPAGTWREMVHRDAGDWRSRGWTAVQVFEIDEATFVEPGKETLTLRRDGSDWLRTIGEGDEETIPYSVASDALYPATEARAEEILDREAAEALGYVFDSPALEIRFRTGEDDEAGEEILRLWSAATDDLHAATTEARDVVLLLPAAEMEKLRAAIDAARNAENAP